MDGTHGRHGPEAQRRETSWRWLIRLRWGAFASQAVLVLLVDRFSAIHLPVPKLLGLLAFGAATNAAIGLFSRRFVREWMLAATLALDLLILTAMLSITGGPHNPFSALYLVHIALAPVVLGVRYTWSLVALAIACYALLFVDQSYLSMKDDSLDHATVMRIHLRGMWLAFTIAAAFIGYFVHKVQRAREQLEDELARSRAREARSEKLGALATLAAGAAHELSTPLSTIAVAVKEMERRLSTMEHADGPPLLEDARLIRQQVERCRNVLEQMSADAGTSLADALTTTTAEALLATCRDGLAEAPSVTVEIDPTLKNMALRLPLRSLATAVRGLVKNAQEASTGADAVTLRAVREGRSLDIVIADRGAGMASDVLARAGEPFFTTKAAGAGMGLGLFLAGAVAEHLGGSLDISSTPSVGTTIHVRVPDCVAER